MHVKNRIKHRWPSQRHARIELAKSDLKFVMICDRIGAQAGEETSKELVKIGDEAAAVLDALGVPQSDWGV